MMENSNRGDKNLVIGEVVEEILGEIPYNAQQFENKVVRYLQDQYPALNPSQVQSITDRVLKEKKFIAGRSDKKLKDPDKADYTFPIVLVIFIGLVIIPEDLSNLVFVVMWFLYLTIFIVALLNRGKS